MHGENTMKTNRTATVAATIDMTSRGADTAFVVYDRRERDEDVVATAAVGETLPTGSSVLEAWVWSDGRWNRLRLHRYGGASFSHSPEKGWEAQPSNDLAAPIAAAAIEGLNQLGLIGPVHSVETRHGDDGFVVFRQPDGEIDTRYDGQILPSGSIVLEAWGWVDERWNRFILNQEGAVQFRREGRDWMFEVGTSHPTSLGVGITVKRWMKELQTFSGEAY